MKFKLVLDDGERMEIAMSEHQRILYKGDRNLDDPDYAGEQFKRAKLAYEFLNDKAQRARYDRERAEPKASERASDRSDNDAFVVLLRRLTESAVQLARQGRDRKFIFDMLISEGCAPNVAQFVVDQAMEIADARKTFNASSAPSCPPETSQSSHQRASPPPLSTRSKMKLTLFLGIGCSFLAGAWLMNLPPAGSSTQKPGPFVAHATTEVVSPAQSVPTGKTKGSDTQVVSSEDPLAGPALAVPILTAENSAVPPTDVPREAWQVWRADQDEFGAKLLRSITAEHPELAWLREPAVLLAKTFEADPTFRDWQVKLQGATRVRVKFLGAREFGGGEDTPLW
ncbi:J domain-containing protein [Paraburkholderia sediminicola]|uniref:J domain-containing protein n=1 Tax=Paraburkholderia rhynchosiae TaxID=487049 RepID=A0ACC7NM96_9BURK